MAKRSMVGLARMKLLSALYIESRGLDRTMEIRTRKVETKAGMRSEEGLEVLLRVTPFRTTLIRWSQT